MMNIGNLGLKWSVVVRFKKGCGLKATGIFVILLSKDGFESDSPESPKESVPTVISESAVHRCSLK